jgi:hyperosmotically inducible periplasmic protein
MKSLTLGFVTLLMMTTISCVSQEIDDVGISAKVKAKLAADMETSAIKIAVDTVKGTVTLSGVVPTEQEKAKAEQLAQATQGVTQVINNITINPESIGATNIQDKAKEAVNDATILSRIKAKLLIENLQGIDVDVENGDVTLKGTVRNEQQLTQAGDIARNTTDVRSVTNQLSVAK